MTAMVPALILIPLTYEAWGQWLGGKGTFWFALLGGAAGLLVASLLFPYVGLAALVAIPVLTMASWETASVFREIFRVPEPAYLQPNRTF